MAILTIPLPFDAHTRFKLLAAKGDRAAGLKLFDKLDSLIEYNGDNYKSLRQKS